MEQNITISIALMNKAIVVCAVFMGWLFYVYLIDKNLSDHEHTNPTIMTWLGLTYVLNILVPLCYALNAAVTTMGLVNEGC